MASAFGQVYQVELVVQQVFQTTTKAPVWFLLDQADIQLRQKENRQFGCTFAGFISSRRVNPTSRALRRLNSAGTWAVSECLSTVRFR